jgi:alpha-beta hydrolase superfamily lysophospholipase
MPGSDVGGQAGWHAARGWIFVSCDHLHVGESTQPSDPTRLTFENVAASNRATVDAVLARLAEGTVADGFPPIADPRKIGIGQSMGGCLLIVQQGQLRTFDGIGVLGYSARHTVLWMPPGTPDMGSVYLPRGSEVAVLADGTLAEHVPEMSPAAGDLPGTTPGFHYDDEPRDLVAADMVDYPTRRGNVPRWASATMPPCARSMLSPGVVAPEAATITVPVFVGVGERDVCPQPLTEPAAYPRATDVTVFVCPRMSHMHNFASTRERFWARLASWADAVTVGERDGTPS